MGILYLAHNLYKVNHFWYSNVPNFGYAYIDFEGANYIHVLSVLIATKGDAGGSDWD